MLLDELCTKIGLAEDAATTLKQTYRQVKDTPLYCELSEKLAKREPFAEIEKGCIAAAETLGIQRYTFMMTLLCGNVHIMKERYLEAGANEKIFWDSAVDFRCKIEECKRVYGVWGIFPFDWYGLLFEAKVFKLGRLEFQKCDEGVVGIHIPSCGPLPYEAVLDSYRRAYVFFGGKNGEPLPFRCSSYLLYPPYQGTVFPENGNIYRFAKDFQIVRIDNKPDFGDAWRVFDTFYNGDASALPQNTSLQRAFVSYIKAGGTFGTGLGLFLFDGEKVCAGCEDRIKEYAKPYLGG